MTAIYNDPWGPPPDDDWAPDPTLARAILGDTITHHRMKPGGTFILDAPDHVPAIWGDGNDVLWAEGEALILVGPPGVGKTTLAGQVLRSRLGCGGPVLGYPVHRSDTKVLYLAMDRPRQIARSLRRTLHDVPRHVLDDRLVVWEGPPIADLAKHPETLVGLAVTAGADTVFVDSLKDAAIGLSEEDVAAGYNRARQTALANGVEVVELHHLVKRGPGGAKPKELADVYGGIWITAGAGSVVLLWGAAGDPIVELTHLKQPSETVGPLQVIHDHTAGISSVFHATDLVQLATLGGSNGVTVKGGAVATYGVEKPTPVQVERIRRRLNSLTKGGLLQHHGAGADGRPDHWTVIHGGGVMGDMRGHGGGHGPFPRDEAHELTEGSRSDVSPQVRGVTDGVTGVTDPVGSRTPPPLEGGRDTATPADTVTDAWGGKPCATCGAPMSALRSARYDDCPRCT